MHQREIAKGKAEEEEAKAEEKETKAEVKAEAKAERLRLNVQLNHPRKEQGGQNKMLTMEPP